MSTKQPIHEGSTDHGRTETTPVSAPAPMTEEKLAAARDPETLDAEAGEAPVFAVAHRTVVVQDFEHEREYEAMLVLYVTRDGERACERRFAVDADAFQAVERAFVAPTDALTATGENASRFAPIVREHPEGA